MIDYLAQQDSDLLVVVWAMSMMMICLVTIALAGVAMVEESIVLGVLAGLAFLLFPVPTVLLIVVGKRQSA